MYKLFFSLLLSSVVICSSSATSTASAMDANLWLGEELKTAAGFPFITKYIEVDKDAPLLVLVPGAHSLARIYYGGKGTREQDFLAFWAKQAGYNFLAISYPLVTAAKVFQTAHPDITVSAWGRGMAEITKELIDQHKLRGNVIVGVWSMGGKSVQPFAQASKALGIPLDFHVSLASTPPIPKASVMSRPFKMHEKGVLQGATGAPRAARELADIAKYNNVAEVIPYEIYLHEYWGHTPAQLTGTGIRYDEEKHALYRDHWEDIQDTQFYESGFPLVAAITPTWQADAAHGMTDHATWGYYNSNTIFLDYAGGMNGVQGLSKEEYAELRQIAKRASNSLTIDVEGNHFFFVGEKGAQATVAAIQELETRIRRLKSDLSAVLDKRPSQN